MGSFASIPFINLFQEEKRNFRRENHLGTSETTSNSSARQAGQTVVKLIYAYLQREQAREDGK
jgi:hypothetical protein